MICSLRNMVLVKNFVSKKDSDMSRFLTQKNLEIKETKKKKEKEKESVFQNETLFILENGEKKIY